jgi:protocatechuate 3,4-dioxygenase beta subunit
MSIRTDRRSLLIASASALGLSAMGTMSEALAAQLAKTPRQTEGPFYPLVRTMAIDPDLIHVPGESGAAFGEPTSVSGRVVDTAGAPMAGVLVEVWQANGYGRYNDARDQSSKPIDHKFKGYGTCVTDADGRYRFLTIKPVAYTGRAPHIHFALSGQPIPRKFVTQMYVAGAPENDRDGLLRSLSKSERSRLLVELDRSLDGEWKAGFDIVIDGKA